jgi:preprotein translocase subunit SecD
VAVPPARTGRPWRRVGLGVAAVVVLGAAATATVLVATRAGRGPDVVMTLSASTVPPSGDLRAAADLLLGRLKAAGYPRPRVTVADDRTVEVRVGSGADVDGLKQLARPGRLSFRAVVAGPATPRASSSAVPSRSSSTRAAPGAAVRAKLGPAYAAAQALSDPGQVTADQMAVLAPFGTLTPDEVATLPPAMQYAVPTVTCAQLNSRAPGAVDDPAAPVVACERTGTQTKYLLDPATVTAKDVAGADVELQAASGWTVTVRFTAAGQPRWTALTRAAVDGNPSNQVAIVVDDQVITAPTVPAVITGPAQISGAEIDRGAADRLAAQLRSGPLPVTFTEVRIR